MLKMVEFNSTITYDRNLEALRTTLPDITIVNFDFPQLKPFFPYFVYVIFLLC